MGTATILLCKDLSLVHGKIKITLPNESNIPLKLHTFTIFVNRKKDYASELSRYVFSCYFSVGFSFSKGWGWWR